MVVLTATYLINRTPSRVLLGKAPFHVLKLGNTLFPIVPRVFGCTCLSKISPTHTKLDNKAVRCVFLGYSSMSKGYRYYDPLTRHFYNYLDVTFLETVPFYSSSSTLTAPVEPVVEDISVQPRPVPIFESLPPVVSSVPLQVYSRRPHAPAPLATSSPDSGISSPPLVSSPTPDPLVPLPRYPTRDPRPPAGFLLSQSTSHPIS